MEHLGEHGLPWVPWRSFEWRVTAVGLVAAVTACLLLFIYQRYRLYGSGLETAPPSAEKERQNRWFHAINAGQWIVILIVGNVLVNIGLPTWVIPAAMFIVGLHFLPLAWLFDNPKHFITGGALMLLAAAYPFLDPGGPGSSSGIFGAGMILWASAFWAVLE